MAFNQTEESLNNLKKNQLVELILHLQRYTTETINKLAREIQKMNGEIQKINETFSKYEANIAITKNANPFLSNQLNETERQCWTNAQHSRTQPTFRRWINVVSTLWINVEITLLRR